MSEMLRRHLGNEVACLGVSINVVEKPDIHFSDGNIAFQRTGRAIYSKQEEVKKLRLLEVLNPYGDNLVRGAEVLVPDTVEVQYILFVLVDKTMLKAVRSGPNGKIFHEFTW